MADQANERLKALKASIKEALGKLTGSDELEAQGVRERSSRGAVGRKTKGRPKAVVKASGEAGVKMPAEARAEAPSAPPTKKKPASGGVTGRPARRRS